jgi:hypothetical protein
MSFSRVAPVVFQRLYRRFDWSRHLWSMAQTAADALGAQGGELRAPVSLWAYQGSEVHARGETSSRVKWAIINITHRAQARPPIHSVGLEPLSAAFASRSVQSYHCGYRRLRGGFRA